MDIAAPRLEFEDLSPATSNTATLAPPSPETEHVSAIATQVPSTSDGRRSASMPQYTSLGQLSYAPATQTTVVTTTTTTTTSFPPLPLKAPRHLDDPKQFPLAASPIPEALKKLSFEYDGKIVNFEETDDVEGSFLQFNHKHASLQSHNGTVRSITNLDTFYETPKKYPSSRAVMDTRPPSQVSKKRPASSISISEAAELASLQRDSIKAKRPRFTNQVENSTPAQHSRASRSRLSQSFDEPTLATPDTGVSQLKTRSKLKKAALQNPLRQEIGADSEVESSGARPSSSRSTRSSSRTQQTGIPQKRADPTRALLGEPFPSAVSATPPIVEEDLELLEQEESPVNNVPLHRPTPLDTLVAQDAALPSPSLSPITAAATFGNANSSQENEDDEDDAADVSSIDIARDSVWTKRRERNSGHTRQPRLDIPATGLGIQDSNPQLPTPTLMDVPTMLDSFDAMPNELQSWMIYHMLRRCNKSTLQLVANVVNPALKCDFLALLPLELSMNVVRYFDIKTMCRAAQVSKKWRQIVDSDETAWKNLMEEDGLSVPQGEVERAVKEGWGWQYQEKADYGEQDLSVKYGARSDTDASSPVSSWTMETEYLVPLSASRPKRKAAGKSATPAKKRRTKAPTPASKQQLAPWVKSLETAQGPIAQANAAAMAVPNPEVGLSTLRNLHLYKSIYRRHYLIKKGWMEEHTEPHHIAFRAHGRHVVTCLQFDSEKIITGSDDTHIHIYDTKTGAEIKALTGHEGGVWALQYDGNILVSGSTDRSVRVWDIEKGRCVQQFLGHTSTVRCLVILKPTKIGEDENGNPIIMPKEPLIITGSRDSTLRVWKLPDLSDRSVPQNGAPLSDSDNPFFVRALTGHGHSVRAIAAHGDTLVSGSYDSTVRVWKISTGDLLHRLQGHTLKVYSVVLDHERNRCISGSMDNTVRVWSLETGAQLYHLDGHTSLVGLLDLGYGRLVSAAADSTLRIWDPENGHCKNTLSAHTGAITCFQHDDQKVISGSDRTLKLWNVKTGECVKDLLTDLSGVWQVKFNERRCVAAVQRDNLTYIEVLDFGAARDGVPAGKRGIRTVVDKYGEETEEEEDDDDDPTNG